MLCDLLSTLKSQFCCHHLIGHPTDARVPWSRWFLGDICRCITIESSATFVSVLDLRHLDVLVHLIVHFSNGSVVFVLEACVSPVVSQISDAVLINIVSFPSNDDGLPRPLRSLSSSASSISSGFDRDRNTSISPVPIKLLKYNCIDFRLFSLVLPAGLLSHNTSFTLFHLRAQIPNPAW